MSTEHRLPAPTANADSLPYWSAARQERLLIRRCSDCGAKHFMPRHLCPMCWSSNLEWIESAGLGTVHSYSVVHRAPTPEFGAAGPYVVALVDLDEGPRMFANVVGTDARGVSIGERVRVVFESRGEDAKVPQFMRLGGAP